MPENFDNVKLVVRHVEDTDTPESAYEAGKRPKDTGFVEIGVDVDGYFQPLASIKAGHFLGQVALAREAHQQGQSEPTPQPQPQEQPQPQQTTSGGVPSPGSAPPPAA